jgi:Cof subfamily protein (haloacid dehalogenase superfamily)
MIQPIELVAIDLDGTLLSSDQKLSAVNIQAIGEVISRGVHLVIASARPPRAVRDIYEQLKLQTLQINYNGAMIYDQPAGEHLYHQPLSGKLARSIVQMVRLLDPQVCVSIETLDRWYTDRIDPALMTQTARLVEPDVLGPLDAAFAKPVTKLMLLAPPDCMETINKAVAAKFAGQVSIIISDEHLLQIVHRQVDKSHALRWVAGHYQVDLERTMAIGDAPNDAGMLRAAGLGVAVANAWATTRQAADVIVPANDEDGVAFALDKYVLSAT